MSADIFHGVLSFSEGIVGGRINNLRARLFRAGIMTVQILDVYKDVRNAWLFPFDRDD